jgi:hypothetical protein
MYFSAGEITANAVFPYIPIVIISERVTCLFYGSKVVHIKLSYELFRSLEAKVGVGCNPNQFNPIGLESIEYCLTTYRLALSQFWMVSCHPWMYFVYFSKIVKSYIHMYLCQRDYIEYM